MKKLITINIFSKFIMEKNVFHLLDKEKQQDPNLNLILTAYIFPIPILLILRK